MLVGLLYVKGFGKKELILKYVLLCRNQNWLGLAFKLLAMGFVYVQHVEERMVRQMSYPKTIPPLQVQPRHLVQLLRQSLPNVQDCLIPDIHEWLAERGKRLKVLVERGRLKFFAWLIAYKPPYQNASTKQILHNAGLGSKRISFYSKMTKPRLLKKSCQTKL